MRKGFFLVELVVVIAVIVLVSVPLARLSTATFRDIPRSYRLIQSNTSVLNMLKQMRKDVDTAIELPESFEGRFTNERPLLIRSANSMICYHLKDGEIIRRVFTNSDVNTVNWPAPHAKIQWQIRRKNNKGYAVEIKTYIERKSGDRLEKKMANSHLYFVGAYREAVN